MLAGMRRESEADQPEPSGGDRVRRHRLSTRLWHWLNAIAVVVLTMSGLNIFNAHPRLYWGEYGANFDPAWLDWSRGERPFPSWATLPSFYSLADARLWHLAFAWLFALGLLLYLLWSLVGGHVRRDLHIRRAEWRPSHIWADVKAHARLRFTTGSAALRYNILQKLAYAAVLFVVLPLLIVTGLGMSPAMDAALPLLTEVWGGRQSARSLHFIAAAALALFVVVHLVMVLLAGPVNEVRAMITGWYRLPAERLP